MTEEPTFADLASDGIPFHLIPPFELCGIPIPLDILDTLVNRYLPGLVRGWVDFNREEVTPGSVCYELRQSELGELGAIELFKTGTQESSMFVKSPPLPSTRLWDERDALDRKRREHQARVIQTLFNLLARDRAWQKHWREARARWAKQRELKHLEMDTTPDSVIRRIEEMQLDLGGKLDDLKQGQVAIYQRINGEDRVLLNSILQAIHQGRIEQGQLHSVLDAIRRTLMSIQEVGLPVDDEALKRSLEDIHQAVNSDISFRHKLELSLPVIPALLKYKAELGAGVDIDIRSVWEALVERVQSRQG